MTRLPLQELLDLSDSGVWGDEDTENGVSVLRSTNFNTDGTLDFSNLSFRVIEDRKRESKLLREGDILLEKSGGGPKQPVGRVCLFRGHDLRHSFGNFIARLRPKANVLSEFLFYFLWHFHATGKTSHYQKQTTGIRNLEYKRFLTIEIPVPPLPEQRRIVDLLARAEGIVRLRREAEKKAAELIPALFLDMFGDPATNPKGWAVERIGDLGRVQLGRQRAPKYQTGAYTRPYVRVANVFEDRIDISDVLSMDFDDKDFTQYKLRYGDILLNEGQSTELVGRPAMWRDEISDCCFQNTLVRFQPDAARMVPEFALAALLNYYRSGVLSQISSKTSNVAHLGAGRFANLNLCCPPVDLQYRFAARFEEMRSVSNQQVSATAKAQETFDALLASVFSAA